MLDSERQSLDVDIVCVGLGPATGGFLKTLSQGLIRDDGTPEIEIKVMPGMQLQVACYERGDDIGFGVSGFATAFVQTGQLSLPPREYALGGKRPRRRRVHRAGPPRGRPARLA